MDREQSLDGPDRVRRRVARPPAVLLHRVEALEAELGRITGVCERHWPETPQVAMRAEESEQAVARLRWALDGLRTPGVQQVPKVHPPEPLRVVGRRTDAQGELLAALVNACEAALEEFYHEAIATLSTVRTESMEPNQQTAVLRQKDREMQALADLMRAQEHLLSALSRLESAQSPGRR